MARRRRKSMEGQVKAAERRLREAPPPLAWRKWWQLLMLCAAAIGWVTSCSVDAGYRGDTGLDTSAAADGGDSGLDFSPGDASNLSSAGDSSTEGDSPTGDEAGVGLPTGEGGGDSDSPVGWDTDPAPVNWPMINGIQWADTEGLAIQAHGGGMVKVGEDYYWFGENRNPDWSFYAVSAYRSRDLRRWEHVNDVLTMTSDPELSPANIERPKVVFNAATQKFVMWMHWENGEHYGEARAAVASSDTVAGDYTYHGSFRPMQDTGVVDHDRPGYMSRDCTLFVDDDGAGYFLSASNENYDLHLYRLSDDYLSIARLEALLFEGQHREAPALFKRNGVYFLLTSGSTGWSPNQAKYATSSALAGGWSEMQTVADGNTFYSQSAFVLAVEGSGHTDYLYMGDRWAGAWGAAVNESAYVWQPITFPDATTMSMSWSNTVEIDVGSGTVSGSVNTFMFINKKSGLVLSVEGSADQNGADIIQNRLEAASAYTWRLSYDAAGHFRLINVAAGKVLDVPNETVEAGVHLHLWDANGGDHQAWRLIDIGEGEYRIRNKNSGHFVGISNGSSEAGASMEQQGQTEGEEQIWRIEAL